MTFGLCFLLTSCCMFDVKKIDVVSAISYVAIAWGNFGFLPPMLRSTHFMFVRWCWDHVYVSTVLDVSRLPLHDTWPTKRWLCNLYIFCIENMISCLQNISWLNICILYSSATGPTLCMKPILRSTVPSLCPLHLEKAEKHVTRALRKAGLNVTSTSKLAPKFHVVVAEYVRQIQSKRRAAQKALGVSISIESKEGNTM